jgi:hypothetical protein
VVLSAGPLLLLASAAANLFALLLPQWSFKFISLVLMIVAVDILPVLVVLAAAAVLLLPVLAVVPTTATVLLAIPTMTVIPSHLLILVVTRAMIATLSPPLAKPNNRTTVLTPPAAPLMTPTTTVPRLLLLICMVMATPRPCNCCADGCGKADDDDSYSDCCPIPNDELSHCLCDPDEPPDKFC